MRVYDPFLYRYSFEGASGNGLVRQLLGDGALCTANYELRTAHFQPPTASCQTPAAEVATLTSIYRYFYLLDSIC